MQLHQPTGRGIYSSILRAQMYGQYSCEKKDREEFLAANTKFTSKLKKSFPYGLEVVPCIKSLLTTQNYDNLIGQILISCIFECGKSFFSSVMEKFQFLCNANWSKLRKQVVSTTILLVIWGRLRLSELLCTSAPMFKPSNAYL